MARPEKLTPEATQQIVTALGVGATYELACRYAGITYQTFRNWQAKGEEAQSGAYVEFVAQVRLAEGRAAIGWLAKIERAANEGTWQAAAWKLERRYPQEYGRTVQEHTGKDGGPIRQTTEHTGVVEVRAVDYRHSIRALAPPSEDAEELRAAG